MRKLKIILLCFISLSVLPLSAQDRPTPQSGLEQHDFFDPTKREEIKEQYTFGYNYRVELGYAQAHQRMMSDTISGPYMHGARAAFLVNLYLPLHFSVELGVGYNVLYGVSEQHYHSASSLTSQAEYLRNNIVEHALAIPVRVHYNIPLWKELSMHLYAGPQLCIGLAETNYVDASLSTATQTWLESQGRHTSTYDRYISKELYRTNLQFGLGGGFTWDVYSLEAGYDFGLHNILRTPTYSLDRMAEWQWHVSFIYTL